jgi:hypothetical protein
MVRDDYDSGRTNLGATGPDAGNEPQEIEEGMQPPMSTNGAQDSMNMNNMLLTNIRVSDYFKLLAEKRTFDEVVDEIYYNVKSAVPWVPGTHNISKTNGMCGAVRGVSAAGRPASCFTLLYKCFTLKLTATQINALINHPDSPYIRVVGFLYLRYCCKPDKLWGWYEQYIGDEDEFYVQGEKYGETDKTQIGPWLRRLLTEMDYHETRLPRIPSARRGSCLARSLARSLRHIALCLRVLSCCQLHPPIALPVCFLISVARHVCLTQFRSRTRFLRASSSGTSLIRRRVAAAAVAAAVAAAAVLQAVATEAETASATESVGATGTGTGTEIGTETGVDHAHVPPLHMPMPVPAPVPMQRSVARPTVTTGVIRSASRAKRAKARRGKRCARTHLTGSGTPRPHLLRSMEVQSNGRRPKRRAGSSSELSCNQRYSSCFSLHYEVLAVCLSVCLSCGPGLYWSYALCARLVQQSMRPIGIAAVALAALPRAFTVVCPPVCPPRPRPGMWRPYCARRLRGQSSWKTWSSAGYRLQSVYPYRQRGRGPLPRLDMDSERERSRSSDRFTWSQEKRAQSTEHRARTVRRTVHKHKQPHDKVR